MTLRSTVVFVMAGLVVVCAARAGTACAQAVPPPPPPGVVVHMPETVDPSTTIPQFEIISIKPAKDNMTRVQFMVYGMHGMSVTTRFLLLEGFGGVSENQVSGAPAWTATEGFDVDAKVAEPDMPMLARLTFEQRRTMFQQILKERFKLVAHHELREQPVYKLVVAKGGPKIQPLPAADPATAVVGKRNGMIFGRGKVTSLGAPLQMFVTPMARLLGRPILDQTGLTGRYDFDLAWTPDATDAAPAADAQSGPDIFTAIQEQLGLKLEPGKAKVDVLVIDHIERPAEN